MTIYIIIIMLLSILIISAFSILNRSYKYFKKYENARILKNLSISEIYDELKSGDIILYKCNTISISSILSQVYYSHIGMVIKYPEYSEKNVGINQDIYRRKSDLYISETNPSFEYLPRDYKINNWYGLRPFLKQTQHEGWTTNYGSDILPLLVRLKYYPGECFIMRLNKKLDFKKEKILLSSIEEKCPYPTALQALKILAEKKFTNSQKTYARHCFQHVGNLLDKMGITNNISKDGFFDICNHIGYIHGQPLNDGYYYETPIQIIYDI